MQDPGTIYDDSGVETFDLPGEPDLYRWRTGSGETVSLLSLRVQMFVRCWETLKLSLRIHSLLTSLQSQGIRDQVLHFLNDLRWLFQRASACSSDLDLVQFSTPRFKYLLLFSSKHEWCPLTKTLLAQFSTPRFKYLLLFKTHGPFACTVCCNLPWQFQSLPLHAKQVISCIRE